MAPNLTHGDFKIVSLTEGNPPVGVNHTKPAFQRVEVNAPVTTWRVREVGDKKYLFAVGGYPFTSAMGNNVIASINPNQSLPWVATYREREDAYTISPIDDTFKGWTVPTDAEDPNPAVVLEIIIAAPAFPPVFLTKQLFQFRRIDDDDDDE